MLGVFQAWGMYSSLKSAVLLIFNPFFPSTKVIFEIFVYFKGFRKSGSYYVSWSRDETSLSRPDPLSHSSILFPPVLLKSQLVSKIMILCVCESILRCFS